MSEIEDKAEAKTERLEDLHMETAEPRMDAVIKSLQACLGKREFVELVKLNERVAFQRKEIARLIAEAARATKARQSLAPNAGEGDLVLDGFGRSFLIKFAGTKGFIDTDDKEHLWWNHYTRMDSKSS